LPLQGLLIVLWLGLVFAFAEGLRRGQHDGEVVRKAVHIGTGNVVPLAWGLGVPYELCLSVAVGFTALAALSQFVAVLPMVSGVGRKTFGVFYYALSITVLVAVFWPLGVPQFAVIGILVMTWGDGMAALIGRRWGRHRYAVWGTGRSLEGSLAMAVVSYGVTAWVLAPLSGWAWLVAGPVAIAASVLEACSPGGTDNLSVPLVSAGLSYGLCWVLGLV